VIAFRVVPWDRNVLVLIESASAPRYLAAVPRPDARGGSRQRRVNISYHIEGDHIAKGDLARLVPLDKMLVDEHRATASGQAKYEWPLSCGVECFDTFYAWALMTCSIAQGAAIMHQ
jgi:hypothetical protein